jgi:hypothetical protein
MCNNVYPPQDELCYRLVNDDEALKRSQHRNACLLRREVVAEHTVFLWWVQRAFRATRHGISKCKVDKLKCSQFQIGKFCSVQRERRIGFYV